MVCRGKIHAFCIGSIDKPCHVLISALVETMAIALAVKKDEAEGYVSYHYYQHFLILDDGLKARLKDMMVKENET